MNKYQEALHNLRQIEQERNTWDISYDVLQELVYKATPMRSEIQALSGFNLYEASVRVCPCCKETLVNVWNRADYKPRYCHCCGQAIDWSDEL